MSQTRIKNTRMPRRAMAANISTAVAMFLRLAVATLPAATAAAQSVVATESLGTVATVDGASDSTRKLDISPDGRHIGYVSRIGSRFTVVIDGVAGPEFDSIGAFGALTSYQRPGNAPVVVFSPDGTRHAYVATKGGQRTIVVDGQAGPPMHASGSVGFMFSPDSKRYAYAITAAGEQGQRVYSDGKLGPLFGAIDALQFSADGGRLAYLGVTALDGPKTVVVDGLAPAAFANAHSLQFSRDGRRVAFAGRGPDGWRMYLDGKPQGQVFQGDSSKDQFLGVHLFRFSADAEHHAYIGSRSSPTGRKAQQVIIDGHAGPSFDSIAELQLSPDGKRHAYLAQKVVGRTYQMTAIVDGKALGQDYERLSDLRFSADSKRVAYQAQHGGLSFILMDGNESEGYRDVQFFRFSPQGSRYAFAARGTDFKWQVVVDGQAGEKFEEIVKDSLTFSPDGSRFVFGAHLRYPEQAVVTDGKSQPMRLDRFGGGYGATLENGFTLPPVIFSPDSKHVTWIGGTADYPTGALWLDQAAAASGYTYHLPTFSPDSKHFAVATRAAGNASKWNVLVNGKAVAEFDEIFNHQPRTWNFLSDGKLQVLGIEAGKYQRITIDAGNGNVTDFVANAPKGNGAAAAASPDKRPHDAQSTVKDKARETADKLREKLRWPKL